MEFPLTASQSNEDGAAARDGFVRMRVKRTPRCSCEHEVSRHPYPSERGALGRLRPNETLDRVLAEIRDRVRTMSLENFSRAILPLL